MARLHIKIPAKSLGTIRIPVRITDINYGNHLGNHALVGILHEARVEFLKQHGYTELSVEGTSLIMSELAVEFKKESFYGDVLDVSLFAGEISRVGFELFYSLSAIRKEGPVIIALAKTGMVCYDYTLKKTDPVPEKLRSLLSP
jgi:acyl-CoA thioesterase FadM